MIHKPETVKYSQLVMPQDANVIGTLFGGQMISWMDIAVSKAAHRILKNSPADAAVTRAIDATEFKEPVHVGEWVNFEAVDTGLGKTSINVKPWSKCCLFLFNVALAKKDRLLGLFGDQCN